MKLATWNVNSINARLERALGFFERVQPDVICLQELKCLEEKFPWEQVENLGYNVAAYGQKTYNGVAILSKEPLEDVKKGFGDEKFDDQARIISADVGKVRVISAYIPNGKEVGSDKYAYKLEWLARLRQYLDDNHKPDDHVVLCGDFNVAPDDRDVYDPEGLKGHILMSDSERQALQTVCDFGLKDTLRQHNEDAGVYSWWDYRALGFQLNKGLRIDFVYASAPMSEVCSEAWVERQERKGKKPSDHAPVFAVFDL